MILSYKECSWLETLNTVLNNISTPKKKKKKVNVLTTDGEIVNKTLQKGPTQKVKCTPGIQGWFNCKVF